MGKVNIFGVETGKKEYSLDTRGKFILSIAYVRIRIDNFLCEIAVALIVINQIFLFPSVYLYVILNDSRSLIVPNINCMTFPPSSIKSVL